MCQTGVPLRLCLRQLAIRASTLVALALQRVCYVHRTLASLTSMLRVTITIPEPIPKLELPVPTRVATPVALVPPVAYLVLRMHHDHSSKRNSRRSRVHMQLDSEPQLEL